MGRGEPIAARLGQRDNLARGGGATEQPLGRGNRNRSAGATDNRSVGKTDNRSVGETGNRSAGDGGNRSAGGTGPPPPRPPFTRGERGERCWCEQCLVFEQAVVASLGHLTITTSRIGCFDRPAQGFDRPGTSAAQGNKENLVLVQICHRRGSCVRGSLRDLMNRTSRSFRRRETPLGLTPPG